MRAVLDLAVAVLDMSEICGPFWSGTFWFMGRFGIDPENRVRMILVLGYWALGNISIVTGGFFHCDTQFNTDQTEIGTVHLITILTSADNGREWFSAAIHCSTKGVGLNVGK